MKRSCITLATALQPPLTPPTNNADGNSHCDWAEALEVHLLETLVEVAALRVVPTQSDAGGGGVRDKRT